MPEVTITRRGDPIRSESGKVIGYKPGKKTTVSYEEGRNVRIQSRNSKVIYSSVRQVDESGKVNIIPGKKVSDQQVTKEGYYDPELETQTAKIEVNYIGMPRADETKTLYATAEPITKKESPDYVQEYKGTRRITTTQQLQEEELRKPARQRDPAIMQAQTTYKPQTSTQYQETQPQQQTYFGQNYIEITPVLKENKMTPWSEDFFKRYEEEINKKADKFYVEQYSPDAAKRSRADLSLFAIGVGDVAAGTARMIFKPGETFDAISKSILYPKQTLTFLKEDLSKTATETPTRFVGRLAGEAATAYYGSKALNYAAKKVDELGTIGKKYVPPEEIIEPEVLSGSQRFPYNYDPDRARAAADLLEEFKTGKYTTKAKELFNLPEDANVGFHGTDVQIGSSTTTARGTSATPGFYEASSLSKYFLKIKGEAEEYAFKLLPSIKRPRAMVISQEEIGGIPGSYLQEAAKAQNKGEFISSLNKYFEEIKGSGKAAVSPEFYYGKPEKEIIAAYSSKFEQVKTGNFWDRITRSEYYTKVDGRRVPVQYYKISPAGEEVISVADDSARFMRSSSYSGKQEITVWQNIASKFKETTTSYSEYSPTKPAGEYWSNKSSDVWLKIFERSRKPETQSPGLISEGYDKITREKYILPKPDYSKTLYPSIERIIPEEISIKPSKSTSSGLSYIPSSSPEISEGLTRPTSTPSYKPTITPRPPAIPIYERFRLRDDEEKRKKRKQQKLFFDINRKYKYSPTAFAIISGQTSKKKQKTGTGLELRPVEIKI